MMLREHQQTLSEDFLFDGRGRSKIIILMFDVLRMKLQRELRYSFMRKCLKSFATVITLACAWLNSWQHFWCSKIITSFAHIRAVWRKEFLLQSKNTAFRHTLFATYFVFRCWLLWLTVIRDFHLADNIRILLCFRKTYWWLKTIEVWLSE
jgi:hypothetical protein